MRLLIVDVQGCGLDVAMRAQRDGHDVKMFIRQSDKTKWIGRGLVTLVDDFKPWCNWADVIFACDNAKYRRDLDAVRKAGHKGVLCASDAMAAWEIDRGAGQKVLSKHGIATIPYKVFNDVESAIVYVKKKDQRFVSKPAGDTEDKAMSYVSKSPEDMVYMLNRWRKLGKLSSPFMLQDFVSGVEMAVGGWFDGHQFICGWCENFEFKKLMNNDLGVATGEQGTVLRIVEQSKLARKVLAPLAGELAREGYLGYVDVNCIIDEKGTPWPLEFTVRPGWPTYNIQTALMKGDTAQWLHELTKGNDADPWLYDRVAIGVVMSVPDYPYSHVTRREVVGIPIYGIKPKLWEHLHPCEMMMGENVPLRVKGEIRPMPMPVTAGDYVLVMTATAETVRDASNTVYRRLERLVVPNSPAYRTDIGRRLGSQLPKIQAKGYAVGMIYTPSVS